MNAKGQFRVNLLFWFVHLFSVTRTYKFRAMPDFLKFFLSCTSDRRPRFLSSLKACINRYFLMWTSPLVHNWKDSGQIQRSVHSSGMKADSYRQISSKANCIYAWSTQATRHRCISVLEEQLSTHTCTSIYTCTHTHSHTQIHKHLADNLHNRFWTANTPSHN